MNYYQDITLLPDAEANIGFLCSKVYQQLHIALVENKTPDKSSAIAVSFPEYGDKQFPLGNKLRVLANTEDQLIKFDTHKWLNRLTDYCHIKSIQPVPDRVSRYACFKRKPIKSIHNKAKRRAEHLGKPYEEVLAYLLEENRSGKNTLPFVNMESQSTSSSTEGKHRFSIFIERVFADGLVVGKFDCYGLSKSSTVPWFD